MIDLTQLQDQIKKKLSVIENQPELENTKSFFLGKKGLITLAFKELGTLDVTIRKEQASKLNIIKDLGYSIENWNYDKLNETDIISIYIKEQIKNYEFS